MNTLPRFNPPKFEEAMVDAMAADLRIALDPRGVDPASVRLAALDRAMDKLDAALGITGPAPCPGARWSYERQAWVYGPIVRADVRRRMRKSGGRK